MVVSLIKIGNSQGIQLPKSFLTQCQIEDMINIEIIDGKIVLEAVKKPRDGWDEQMKTMHKRGDDALVLPPHVDSTLEELQW